MCGIAGIWSEQPLTGSVMAAMCLQFSENLQHRGPDDEGFALIDIAGKLHFFRGNHSMSGVKLPHVSDAQGDFIGAMVHRRLSIIGLGLQGHQPMSSATQRFHITYNGEAFNFKEIANRYGFENETTTDTEIILQLLQEKGIDGLNELEGFFAGMIVDAEQKRIVLFRDPTGVKPLYLAQAGATTFWCSETHALRKVTGLNAILPSAFMGFFAEGLNYTGDGKTMFQEIEEFPKGEIHVFDYSPRKLSVQLLKRQGTPPVNLEQSLEESIEKRLLSDVPLGFAVSGGIDSAAIIGIARRMHPDLELKAYSVVSDSAFSDESEWQKKVVAFNRADWKSVNISKVQQNLLENVVAATDLPPVAWNNLAHFELCRLVKEDGTTVLFNGQGADEIFGGYPDYLQRSYGHFLRLAKRSRTWPISYKEISRGWQRFKIQNVLPNSLAVLIFQQKYSHVLHDDFKGYAPRIWEKAGMSSEQKMADDYYGMKLGQMILWEDRNGMANSLESRNPFADDRNLAMFLNIPFKKKIANGFTKGILREALIHDVPAEVLWRVDKKGFSVPDKELTKVHLDLWKDAFFSDKLNEYAPQERRHKLWNRMANNKEKDFQDFFRLVSFSHFLEFVNG